MLSKKYFAVSRHLSRMVLDDFELTLHLGFLCIGIVIWLIDYLLVHFLVDSELDVLL